MACCLLLFVYTLDCSLFDAVGLISSEAIFDGLCSAFEFSLIPGSPLEYVTFVSVVRCNSLVDGESVVLLKDVVGKLLSLSAWDAENSFSIQPCGLLDVASGRLLKDDGFIYVLFEFATVGPDPSGKVG